MGFRVDAGTSLAFATDLPASVRAIHPSGILHVRRTTVDGNAGPREEHAFAWIENSLHVEAALAHLGALGFDVEPVFVPYSTRRNWTERYPHAAPGLEFDEGGACAAVVRGDAGLAVGNICGIVSKAGDEDEDGAGNGKGNDGDGNRDASPVTDAPDDASAAATRDAAKSKKRRRKERQRRGNMLRRAGSILPDAERDELHVDIYSYLSWLHDALEELERRGAEAAELERSVASMIPAEDEDDEDEGGEEGEEGEDDEGVEEEGGDGRKRASTAGTRGGKRKRKKGLKGVGKDGKALGVDVTELKGVLEKLESTFAILPNVKLEWEAAAAAVAAAEEATEEATEEAKDTQGDGDEQLDECKKEGEDDPTQQQEQKQQQQDKKQSPQALLEKRHQNLEEALSASLAQRVEARERAGKLRRRSRKRLRQLYPEGRPNSNPNRCHSRAPVDFDELFRRLKQYIEVHGHSKVPKKYPEDQQLSCFVKDIRFNMTKLKRQGLAHDEIPVRAKHATRVSGKILTAERIARLDSIGFCWNVWEAFYSKVPRLSWQERFEEAVGYREEHGRWPSQSMGTLGQWMHRQRKLYAMRDKNFMRDKVPKLDEVGFEWTPRGNTKISWDEGFERLIEFGRINGHYEVPCPSPMSELAEKKFHKWVESLHSMYRSYQLGRQHGSLTEDRIALLAEHGFQFRTTLSEEVE